MYDMTSSSKISPCIENNHYTQNSKKPEIKETPQSTWFVTSNIADKILNHGGNLMVSGSLATQGFSRVALGSVGKGTTQLCIAILGIHSSFNQLSSLSEEANTNIENLSNGLEAVYEIYQNSDQLYKATFTHFENISKELIPIREVLVESDSTLQLVKSFNHTYETLQKDQYKHQQIYLLIQNLYNTTYNIEQIATENKKVYLSLNQSVLMLIEIAVKDISSLREKLETRIKNLEFYIKYLSNFDEDFKLSLEDINNPLNSKQFVGVAERITTDLQDAKQKVILNRDNLKEIKKLISSTEFYKNKSLEYLRQESVSGMAFSAGVAATIALSPMGFIPAVTAGLATTQLADETLFPTVRKTVKAARKMAGRVNSVVKIPLGEKLDIKFDSSSSGTYNFYWKNSPSTTVGDICIKLNNHTEVTTSFNLNNKEIHPIDAINSRELVKKLIVPISTGLISPQEMLDVINILEKEDLEFSRTPSKKYQGQLIHPSYFVLLKRSLLQLKNPIYSAP